MQALKTKWPTSANKKAKLEKLFKIFVIVGNRMLYNRQLCVPQKAVSSILRIAYDSKIGGDFSLQRLCPDDAIFLETRNPGSKEI